MHREMRIRLTDFIKKNQEKEDSHLFGFDSKTITEKIHNLSLLQLFFYFYLD